MQADWGIVYTLIKVLLPRNGDQGLHCLIRFICPNAQIFYGLYLFSVHSADDEKDEENEEAAVAQLASV